MPCSHDTPRMRLNYAPVKCELAYMHTNHQFSRPEINQIYGQLKSDIVANYAVQCMKLNPNPFSFNVHIKV